MTVSRGRLAAALDWLADRQLLLVALLAPLFMLADRLPRPVVGLAVLALLPAWGIYRWARGHFFTRSPVDLPLLILAATLPLGFWAAALPERALPFLIQSLIGISLFYALLNSVKGERRVLLAGGALLAGTALLAGLGLAGTAWASQGFLSRLTGRLPQVISLFWYSQGFNSNIVGGALALLAPVTVAYAWGQGSWGRRVLFGGLALLEVVTLLLTQSRGALAGLAVALVVVAVARDRRWVWVGAVLVILLAVGLLIIGLDPALDWVMGGGGEAAVSGLQDRLALFARGLAMLQDFPLTGVGLGMFPEVLPLLYPLFHIAPETRVAHVHNIYLQAGIDHGIIGMLAFWAMLIIFLVMAVQAVRRSGGQRWEPLALGLLGGMAAYLVHGLVDAIWHSPRSEIILWAFWGLLAAVWLQAQRAGQPE